MSVHSADYKKVKKLLGVPEEEPIFIIRGQDDLGMAIVTRYLNMAQSIESADKMPNQEWLDHMSEIIAEFGQFRIEYPERIKIAD